MKRVILYLAAILVVFTAATSCMKDIPSMDIPQEAVYVDSTGGDIVIPFYSTGFDDAQLEFLGKWETDNQGDMTLADPWIEIKKVDSEYTPTKTLLVYHSAIILSVKPNDSGYLREAVLKLRSFQKYDQVKIIQTSPLK